MAFKLKKIFIGLHEIASQIGVYKAGFESLGLETMTAVDLTPPVINEGHYDFNLDHIPTAPDPAPGPAAPDKELQPLLRNVEKKKFKEFIRKKALAECDAFFFIWNSFEKDYGDFAELKRQGKKIVVNFVGDDIRWKPAMEQDFSRFSLPPMEYRNYSINLVRQLHYLRTAEKYADLILSLPNQAQLALRPYYNFFYPLDLQRISENPRQRQTNPVVLHAPSDNTVKGTKYIRAVFEQLQKEGIPFRPRMLEGIPHAEILEIYKDSDILVGQVLCPGGGKQAFELLAAGKVVLTRMGYGYYPQMAEKENPIIDVGPDTLYRELKAIILDYPRRAQLARKGRSYVEKYHDVRKLCQNILTWLQSNDEQFHFFPRFFRETFNPETPEVCWIYNKYNQYVKACHWYQRYISPGARQGLIF